MGHSTQYGRSLGVRVPDDEKHRIDRLAADLGLSRNRIVRAALLALEAAGPQRAREFAERLPPDGRLR